MSPSETFSDKVYPTDMGNSRSLEPVVTLKGGLARVVTDADIPRLFLENCEAGTS